MKNNSRARFKNGVFDKHEWSAEVYDSPDRILDAFNSLGVCGKTIVGINTIGATGCAISSAMWRIQREAGVPYEIAVNDKYEYIDQILIPCEVSVSEPVVLAFGDGSTFELQPVDNLSLKMSTNQIPREITDGINHSNFDANVVFHELLGSSLKSLRVYTFHMESASSDSISRYTYKDIKEEQRFRRYIFRTSGEIGFSITQRGGGRYSLELRNQNHFTHDGLELVSMPFAEIQKSFKPIRQITILEGHCEGSSFWIMPVKQLSSCNEGRYGFEVHKEEEISIEEDDVFHFLYYFLGKYFDEDFEYIYRDEIYEGKFAGHLEHNIYTYAAIRAMIAEIRSVAEMLQNDFDNPALVEVKDRFCPFDFAGYKGIDTMCVHNMNQEEKNELFRANIDIVIDFYERFCRRMEAMMEYAPQYDQISFMGP